MFHVEQFCKMKISGKIIDIHKKEIYPGLLIIKDGRIYEIIKRSTSEEQYICPGLVDAHIHIESSMLTPGSFAGAAVSRGTIGVISDPHEIANVIGVEGVKYMIDDARKTPLKFYFGAPSCVPATSYETTGAKIDLKALDELLASEEIKYLAEMMNFPGVIFDDPEVHAKINLAKKYNKPVDGHAPGVTGEALRKYISSGITTDHECVSLKEAEEKLSLGMKILIREGSAAKNLESLKPLFKTHPDEIMLCTDDLHPEMLSEGHINKIVANLINDGFDIFDVIKSCTLNPALHYNLNTGLLRPGDPADFIITDDFNKMDIKETWINGEKVFDKGSVNIQYSGSNAINKFNCSAINEKQITIKYSGKNFRVIEAFDGELITKELIIGQSKTSNNGYNLNSDILKIVVKDRYTDLPPAVGLIKGFGLKSGAFASSVAHDSHNIICIGTNDTDIVHAVNNVIAMKGGLSVVDKNYSDSLKLEIAGIISDRPLYEVASKYKILSEKVKSLGCKLTSPFMTLSFMALLVIPEIKISDKGLFDVRKFEHFPLTTD